MSKRYDANTELFEKVIVFEKYEALLSYERIDMNTIPKNMYTYEIRHDDEGKGDIVELGLAILVNFYGTLITKEEIPDFRCNAIGNAYKDISDKDIVFVDHSVKISDF